MNSGFDGQADLQEDFVVLADSFAIWTEDFRVELSNQGLEDGIVGLIFGLFEMVIEDIDEVEEEVVGVMLFISFELNSCGITGVRL